MTLVFLFSYNRPHLLTIFCLSSATSLEKPLSWQWLFSFSFLGGVELALMYHFKHLKLLYLLTVVMVERGNRKKEKWQEGDFQFIPIPELEGNVALLALSAGEEGVLWAMRRSMDRELCLQHNRCSMNPSSWTFNYFLGISLLLSTSSKKSSWKTKRRIVWFSPTFRNNGMLILSKPFDAH